MQDKIKIIIFSVIFLAFALFVAELAFSVFSGSNADENGEPSYDAETLADTPSDADAQSGNETQAGNASILDADTNPEDQNIFSSEFENGSMDIDDSLLAGHLQDPDYITVELDSADIHRGHLILVNSDHAMIDIDTSDFVYIVQGRTSNNVRAQFEISMLSTSIMEPLGEMMDEFVATTGNTSIAIISGFRSYSVQQGLLERRIAEFGYTEAHRIAARPGHSEHHTGIAFDLGILIGGNRTTFTGTGETAWFPQNAHRFGFIVRYPADKTHITGVIHEPWHFRYVGIPHAYAMRENNWVLEEYIDALRNHTIDNPLIIEANGITHEIFFTTESELTFPFETTFKIQGNNIDGFIVTVVQ